MKLTKKSSIYIAGPLLIVIVAIGVYYFTSNRDIVKSYEECDKLYNQNVELYTGTCITPDGQVFTSPNP